MKYSSYLKRALVAFVLTMLAVASVSSASNLPLPSTEATASITVRDLKKHLNFLASDELGGRYTFSKSNLIAARYLAAELESYGYRGGARDGSFFQKVPLNYRSVDATRSAVTLNAAGAKQEFKFADDFIAESPSDANLSGGLVFAGYGISAPKHNHDDYAGLDVKGKIVVIASGIPSSLKNAKVDEAAKLEAALSHGASAIIAIAPPQFQIAWQQVKFYVSQEQVSLPPRTGASGKTIPVIVAGPNMIKAIARLMGKEDSYLSKPTGERLEPAATAATAEIRLAVNVKDAGEAQNVVGVLEGADPQLKNEYVAFSAHYDHEKTGENGEVYNGADDDGSGTSAVLEIAEAFATGARPKRSVLIIFHTAEELGLYGSAYNADYEPVVPLDRMVANFNIDMIGRSREESNKDPRDRELTDKNSVYVIGADKLSTELHKISEQTNADTERLRFDYTYNDENHPQRFYYRSDHYNYAKHGVPIIFYFTGVHRDYHKPTDDISKLDFAKMERITKLIFATGWRVAGLDHRLIVDKSPAPPSAFQ